MITERQGIVSDFCLGYDGVWLERGELDNIIERAAPAVELDGYQPDRSRRDDPVQEGDY